MKILIFLLLAVVITGSNQVSGVTVIDLRNGKSGFEVHEINGVKILIAPEVALPLKGTTQKGRLLSNMRRVLKQTEKLMPRTYSEFNRLSYKVYLLHEPHASNRLEFIREGQEKWDRRIPRDGSMSRSIMIFRTLDFFDPPYDIFYFVHEMAHFHHIGLNENMNSVIKGFYEKAVKTNRKFGGLYAAKNHMEYYAEVSATYLMPSHMVPRKGLPKGAAALKEYSAVTHEMCKRFWGNENNNNYPYKKPPPAVAVISGQRNALFTPPETMWNTTLQLKPTKISESEKELWRIQRVIRKAEYYEVISRIGFTAEGTPEQVRKKALEFYERAHIMMIIFQRRHPNHNIDNIRRKVMGKIGITNGR